MSNKTTVLILGSPGITRLMSATLSPQFDVESLSPNTGANGMQFDTVQAKDKLLRYPNIRKLFLVPHQGLCNGAKEVIAFAARLGKRSTVVGDTSNADAAGQLRDESAAIGAEFLPGDFDHDTLLATAMAGVGRQRAVN